MPTSLFDTQIAAGFVGMSMPSLASLYEKILGIRVGKGDRLTDWLARPLNDAQLVYAAGDVEHLLEVYDHLVADLTERGRLEWALDECEDARVRARGARDPEDAWRRVKEIRQLRGPARRVAQSVAGWRERRAAEVDQPVRSCCPTWPSSASPSASPDRPTTCRKIRGLDDRHLRGNQAESRHRRGRRKGWPDPRCRPRSPSRASSTGSCALRWPWCRPGSASSAATSRSTPPCSAPAATSRRCSARTPGARLAVGWRAELVGEPIRRLVDGEAALAFDGHGELVLEARSRRPLG